MTGWLTGWELLLGDNRQLLLLFLMLLLLLNSSRLHIQSLPLKLELPTDDILIGRHFPCQQKSIQSSHTRNHQPITEKMQGKYTPAWNSISIYDKEGKLIMTMQPASKTISKFLLLVPNLLTLNSKTLIPGNWVCSKIQFQPFIWGQLNQSLSKS